jgi:hypothetical protein
MNDGTQVGYYHNKKGEAFHINNTGSLRRLSTLSEREKVSPFIFSHCSLCARIIENSSKKAFH